MRNCSRHPIRNGCGTQGESEILVAWRIRWCRVICSATLSRLSQCCAESIENCKQKHSHSDESQTAHVTRIRIGVINYSRPDDGSSLAARLPEEEVAHKSGSRVEKRVGSRPEEISWDRRIKIAGNMFLIKWFESLTVALFTTASNNQASIFARARRKQKPADIFGLVHVAHALANIWFENIIIIIIPAEHRVESGKLK